jgi:NADPH-dependent stearoyl-CoA 9-desaturase
MKSTSRTLTTDELEAFGRELDALGREVAADLGQRDVDHIRAIIRIARQTEAGGRLLLHFGLGPVSFAAGVAALSTSKILENMEIGHNVMHGQYDWTRDPELDSHEYDWDSVCAAADWRHSHNYEHHTFTNIVGRDRDIGYGLLRVTPEQPWHPGYLVQPISAAMLALLFQWGVAVHDLRLNETLRGTQPLRVLWKRADPFLRKAAWQVAKDYAFYPALALANAPRVAAGNFLANGARNLWSFAIIFCGHFPDGVRMYHEHETRDESRGAWYVRQLNGSANIEGGRKFHVMSGHLSHQIEHHLFPEIPASRYPEMAPRVRAICERYGQAYNTGSFGKQLGSVAKRIFKHALPPLARRRAPNPTASNPSATRTVRRASGARPADSRVARAASHAPLPPA